LLLSWTLQRLGRLAGDENEPVQEIGGGFLRSLGHAVRSPKSVMSTVPCAPVQAYKALQCWLYQCAEGDIPEKSKRSAVTFEGKWRFFSSAMWRPDGVATGPGATHEMGWQDLTV